jgi:hypothetical protein
LLAEAAEQAALVVMGAYGNSQLRQWIFGGFTAPRQIVTDSPNRRSPCLRMTDSRSVTGFESLTHAAPFTM